MKIYYNLSEFKPLSNAVVTIGTFDGVHLGHQKIINRLTEVAHARNGESVLLTFFPHPRMIIDPQNAELKMINTVKEKASILEKLGVDHLIITPFTRDFSNQTPLEYIKNVLIDRIGTKYLIIGYDHHFGKNRLGNITDLEKYASKFDYQLEEIPALDIDAVSVSSTKIRTALLSGDVALANSFLSYPFSLSGNVIKGDKIGRTIGFPTANIFIEETYKLIPSDGIYAVTVEISNTDNNRLNGLREYKGMAYIGQRPTINGMTRNIEVNIFDFNEEIYGQDVKMIFHEFLRGDAKFSGLEELTIQLKKDKKDTLAYFNKRKL